MGLGVSGSRGSRPRVDPGRDLTNSRTVGVQQALSALRFGPGITIRADGLRTSAHGAYGDALNLRVRRCFWSVDVSAGAYFKDGKVTLAILAVGVASGFSWDSAVGAGACLGAGSPSIADSDFGSSVGSVMNSV